VPDSPFLILNGSQNYLGKAWDDRIGCAVLLEAMRRTATLPHPNTLLYVATVQEEIGLRGARTAAQIARPEIGIAIEGGITGDTAGTHPEETQAKLGAGPGLFLYDSSTLPSRSLVAFTKRGQPHPTATRSGAGLWRRFGGDAGLERRHAHRQPRRAGPVHART
jgi:endoglucanase